MEWNIRVTMTEIEEDTVQLTLDEWVKNAPTLDDFAQREIVEQAILEEALEIVSRPIWKEPWMNQVEEVRIERGNPHLAGIEDPKKPLWETTRVIEDPMVALYGSFSHPLDPNHWFKGLGSGLGPIETPKGSPKTLFKRKNETWSEARVRSGGFEEE
tara:strand:+ start:9833 stop:10303 length:471 start_codon:yes stop_codon:yes gene_type:complete